MRPSRSLALLPLVVALLAAAAPSAHATAAVSAQSPAPQPSPAAASAVAQPGSIELMALTAAPSIAVTALRRDSVHRVVRAEVARGPKAPNAPADSPLTSFLAASALLAVAPIGATCVARMTCQSKIDQGYGTAVGLFPVYSSDPDDPNKAFTDATPSGNVQLFITPGRPAAEVFEAGATYDVTFTKVKDASVPRSD